MHKVPCYTTVASQDKALVKTRLKTITGIEIAEITVQVLRHFVSKLKVRVKNLWGMKKLELVQKIIQLKLKNDANPSSRTSINNTEANKVVRVIINQKRLVHIIFHEKYHPKILLCSDVLIRETGLDDGARVT